MKRLLFVLFITVLTVTSVFAVDVQFSAKHTDAVPAKATRLDKADVVNYVEVPDVRTTTGAAVNIPG